MILRVALLSVLLTALWGCSKAPERKVLGEIDGDATKAPERKVLGGIDGDAYCRSIGKTRATWIQDPAQFENLKTWGCESPEGWQPFSVGVICTAQYGVTAHGEQEIPGDPLTWVCVEGAAPSDAPASWNRANR